MVRDAGSLDRGEPLPPPFDDLSRAFDRLSAGEPPATAYVAITSGVDVGAPRLRVSRPYAAIPALTAAAEADPLRAAVDAVHAAAAAHDEDAELFAALRRAFPALR